MSTSCSGELKSEDPKYDRLKTIKQNPREVIIRDIETDEIKTFPSIYEAGKFINQAPMTVRYWDGKIWNNKYNVVYFNFIMSMCKT